MVSLQKRFVVGKCKYCGRSFIKKHNKEAYCSTNCRKYAKREQKAKYQRKRRRLINSGELISNETEQLGTGYLSAKRNSNFEIEARNIRKELKRLLK